MGVCNCSRSSASAPGAVSRSNRLAAIFRTQMRSPRQDMPRYGDKFLSDSDINDIHAWLSTIKGGPKAKDIPLLANL